MKRKGFTLIELLAVIVILAIIALIAMPMVLNTIDEAKKGSDLRSVEGFASAVEQTVFRIMMESGYTGGDILCEATEQKTTCYEKDNNSVSKEVAYKGNKITGGTIKYDHKLELLVMTELKVGSSDNKYAFTTVGGANVVTPDECFSVTDDGILSAASDFSENNKCTSDLVIPSEVNGVKVVEIALDAFTDLDKKITSVVISEGVEKINGAFNRNLITYVILPSSVSEIDQYSFSYNNIEYVNLPENVKFLGDSFTKNNLETLILPKGVTFTSSYDFDLCNIKNLIISDGVTMIGEGTFDSNQITDLVIPGSVQKIDYNAFYNNPITNLTLSEGITELYGEAFRKNNLTSVTIPSTVIFIGNDVFAENSNLTTIVNKTGRAFDWKCVLGGGCDGTTQVTGTYTIGTQTVNVVEE